MLLPAWWTRQGAKTRPSIRAKAKAPPMQGGSGLSMTSLIDLDVEIALGDDPISPEELQELADLKVPLVRFRGQWVEINAEDIQAAADFWRNRNQVTLRDAVQIGLGADQQAEADNVSLIADDWLKDLLEQLQEKASIDMLTTARPVCWRAAAVPATRLLMAGVPQQVGPGRLPGRRHGSGKDRADPGCSCNSTVSRATTAPTCWSARPP